MVFTIGHGTRPAPELVTCLQQVGARTLVDVRRFPSSRRNPQFDRDALAATLEAAGIAYLHAPELGGRVVALSPASDRRAPDRAGP